MIKLDKLRWSKMDIEAYFMIEDGGMDHLSLTGTVLVSQSSSSLFFFIETTHFLAAEFLLSALSPAGQ